MRINSDASRSERKAIPENADFVNSYLYVVIYEAKQYPVTRISSIELSNLGQNSTGNFSRTLNFKCSQLAFS